MSRDTDFNFPVDCKVYIGNLRQGNMSSLKYHIQNAFKKFGPLRDVWVATNPSGFAIIHFFNPHDAKDAVRVMDGTGFLGTRIRVERGRRRRNCPPSSHQCTRDSSQSYSRNRQAIRCRDCPNCGRRMTRRNVSRSPPPIIKHRSRSLSKKPSRGIMSTSPKRPKRARQDVESSSQSPKIDLRAQSRSSSRSESLSPDLSWKRERR